MSDFSSLPFPKDLTKTSKKISRKEAEKKKSMKVSDLQMAKIIKVFDNEL